MKHARGRNLNSAHSEKRLSLSNKHTERSRKKRKDLKIDLEERKMQFVVCKQKLYHNSAYLVHLIHFKYECVWITHSLLLD